MAYNPTKDTGWVRRSFFLPKLDRAPYVLTPASQKYTNTSLGGNVAINPPPQFCEYADPMVAGRGGTGMGRYYSEHIDDSAVHLHMRVGVPKFNSMTNFFIGPLGGKGFYDPNMSYLARTGQERGGFYSAGKLFGFLFTAPLQPIIFVGRAVKMIFNVKPSSRWYNLKPTMPLYWGAVNVMVNQVAVNMNLIPPILGGGEADYLEGSNAASVKDVMHNLDPRIFRPNGSIDMFAVATKAQRLHDAARKKFEEDVKRIENRETVIDVLDEYVGTSPAYMYDTENITSNSGTTPEQLTPSPGDNTLEEYLKRYLDSTEGKGKEVSAEAELDAEGRAVRAKDDGSDSASSPSDPEDKKSWASNAWSSFWEGTNDAAEFVTFNVRSKDSVSESVSNSAGESELASTLNNMNSSGRTRNFAFAGGNAGDNPAINALESVGNALKDFAVGTADAVGLSGLAAFNGAAFVDIPKYWQDSSVTFPRMSYKMELRSPYGHPMARMQYEMIPMMMILAMALPRSTGKQSYTSPFLVEAYCQGRGQVRIGLIDSVTITRGVGNMPWSKKGEPRGIDVDFSIMDLSSIMTMPLNSDQEMFDDENAYTDYLATLGGLSLSDQIYSLRKLNIEMTRAMSAARLNYSSSKLGVEASGSSIGQLISAFRPGVFYE